MISVTVGTISFPFDRLIEWVSDSLEDGIIQEPVFLQYGCSNIERIEKHPLVTAVSKVSKEILQEKLDESRLVISHAGQGSTRYLSSRGMSFIIVPRLAKYREHIDDHQLLFSEAVEDLGVIACYSKEHLQDAIINSPVGVKRDLFDGPKLGEYLNKKYPQDFLLSARENSINRSVTKFDGYLLAKKIKLFLNKCQEVVSNPNILDDRE
ncbi:glycosyltransferase [Nodosilinea sp. E11]|uniref:glycosyltransferase n=1 Tax=Nodosilinea sp. E11 TaxID=3037479 RepID=UPI002934D798|nr:glycosyltransferase [Nodosilinea sp. E11]WOD37417.1 glycosyltransferase [Nodosilinea sp. E11]